jgi:ribosome-associated toxin RatA of RatAB toxin-antitoxin module
VPVARHSAVIDASMDEVMAVICDFGAYPEFLPEMEKTEILSEEDGTWEVRFHIRIIRRLSYTLRLIREGPDRLSWTLIEGAFKTNRGSWSLHSTEKGTRADYQIDLQIGHFVPSNIVRSLVERTLPETVSRFKSETEGRGSGSPS